MCHNQLKKGNVLKMFVRWLKDNGDGIEPYYGYSGRGMFGELCFGLDCHREKDVFVALLDFALDGNMETLETIRDLIAGHAQDSMGRGMIVYFPEVDIKRWEEQP